MGKWKKMGLDSNKDIICCPKCKGIFVHRKLRCCPFCGVKLIYPGEGVSSESEGYIYCKGWKKISEIKIEEKK